MAYEIMHRVTHDLNESSALDCVRPEGGKIEQQAALYYKRNTNDTITR